MKERPIPFTTPMVQAILDGRKTMTRRIIKPQPQCIDYTWDDPIGYDGNGRCAIQDDELQCLISCKYGRDGDQLWVRETFMKDGVKIHYRADNPDRQYDTSQTKWTFSRFMPRTASRIQLLIKSIRVERLQDISGKNAENEGVYIDPVYPSPRMEFAHLWESINGKGSWDANPWVWVIEFERVKS